MAILFGKEISVTWQKSFVDAIKEVGGDINELEMISIVQCVINGIRMNIFTKEGNTIVAGNDNEAVCTVTNQ